MARVCFKIAWWDVWGMHTERDWPPVANCPSRLGCGCSVHNFLCFCLSTFFCSFFFFLKPSTYKMGTVSSTLQSCRGARGCGSQLGTPWSLTPAAPALPSGPKGSTVNRHSCLDVGPEVPASRPGSSVRRMPLAAAPSTSHGHRPPPGLTTTNCSNSQRRLNQDRGESKSSHYPYQRCLES